MGILFLYTMVQVIIGALVGLIGGGIATAVIQATVLKNRKNQIQSKSQYILTISISFDFFQSLFEIF